MLRTIGASWFKKLYKPKKESSGEDNGQVTIIGGSSLFHGASLLSLKVASKIVDMVFFASPEENLKDIANRIKSKLFSFIWIPWEETEKYIEKSDAILIGPGFMRHRHETRNGMRDTRYDESGKFTREITKRFLTKFPEKKWVIDAGSLQVMDGEWIPEGAILTPNSKEFEILFKMKLEDRDLKTDDEVEGKHEVRHQTSKVDVVKQKAEKHNCIIVMKGPETVVCSPYECVGVGGGNPGLTKGGTGDVLAGLTVAILAKNEPFLAASCASYIAKAAADELYTQVGTNYNADDLADRIPLTLNSLLL